MSLGLLEPAFLQLMRAAGFRPVEAATPVPAEEAVEGAETAETPPASAANWVFKGRQKPRPDRAQHARPRTGRPDNEQKPRGDKPAHGRRGCKDGAPAPSRANATSGSPAPANNAFAGLAELLGRNG